MTSMTGGVVTGGISDDFTPANPSNWLLPTPTTLPSALDQLASSRFFNTENGQVIIVPNSTSIQQAIDDAIESGYGGDSGFSATLLIYPGVYAEDLTLYPGIHLQALGGHYNSVIISGQINYTPDPLLTMDQNTVTLTGINIDAIEGKNAINVQGTASGVVGFDKMLVNKRGDNLEAVIINNPNIQVGFSNYQILHQNTTGTVVSVLQGNASFLYANLNAAGVRGGDKALYVGSGAFCLFLMGNLECAGNVVIEVADNGFLSYSIGAIINNQIDADGLLLGNGSTAIIGYGTFLIPGIGYMINGVAGSTYMYGINAAFPGYSNNVNAAIGNLLPFETTLNVV